MAEEVQESNNNDQPHNYKELFPADALLKLSEGFTATYKPPLEKTKEQLGEILEKQEVLYEQLHDENLKVSWTQNSVDILKMFDVISTYHLKLTSIKKDMKTLHDKNVKLKKRVLRLEQYKEKLANVQKQQQQQEQNLIGPS